MPILTTTTLQYPHEFRPVPRFRIDVPADWKVLEYPGSLFAVSSVDPDAAWMNIIVSHERIAVGTHNDVLIKRYTALVATYDDIVVEPEKGFRLGDIEFVGRDSTYTDPDMGVSVNRFEASTTAPNPIGLLVDDLFTLTFLVPGGSASPYTDVVLDTLTSFRFV